MFLNSTKQWHEQAATQKSKRLKTIHNQSLIKKLPSNQTQTHNFSQTIILLIIVLDFTYISVLYAHVPISHQFKCAGADGYFFFGLILALLN